MVSWQLIVSGVLVLIGIAVIIIGIMIAKESIKIPEEKKSQWAIGGIVTALVLGIINIITQLKPTLPTTKK